MKQKAPFDIPELDIKEGQLVFIPSAYVDAALDFRLEVMNPKMSKSVWFMYDNKFEALEEGWEV